jgi:hypothetical protein
MERVYIVGSSAGIDGAERYRTGLTLEEAAGRRSLRMRELTISPLGEGWGTPLPDGHFRCGSAPVDALEVGVALLRSGKADLVAIKGEDNLRTGYTSQQRVAAMEIYPEIPSVAQGYDLLARSYLEKKVIDIPGFIRIRNALFDNYLKTFLADKGEAAERRAPAPAWYEPVTPLFRGVDCANPVIDFKGELLLATGQTATRLNLEDETAVEIAGVATGHLDRDGPEAVDEIAQFTHLRRAIEGAQSAAGVNIAEAFNTGAAHLEVYTCFPVIPLAFLLESGICEAEGLEEVISHKSLTITGGMNLARAPWNNPALHGLIAMHHRLLEGGRPLGIVHGNGGLGFRQGVAVLGRVER